MTAPATTERRPGAQTEDRPRRRNAALRQLLSSPSGVFAAVVLLLFLIVGFGTDLVAPYAPNEQGVGPPLAAPSAEHWFGTDELGRDQLSRVMAAAGVAMSVALASVALAIVAGAALGILSGYAGGYVDKVLVRLMDVIFSFPALMLAIVVVAVLGPGLRNAIYAIAIVYVPRFARVARGSTLTVKNLEFIEAARLAGVKPVRIVFRHVVRNILTPLIILAALSMSTAQLAYAALSFLGLGVSPPQADYGSMLARARNFMTFASWLVIYPAAALVTIIVAFNFMGDAVRDLLDPMRRMGAGKSRGDVAV